jgi:hypothetical protein
MNSDAMTGPATGPADARGRMGGSARAGMFPPFGLLDLGPETVRASLARAWPPPLATAVEGKNRRWAWWSWAA